MFMMVKNFCLVNQWTDRQTDTIVIIQMIQSFCLYGMFKSQYNYILLHHNIHSPYLSTVDVSEMHAKMKIVNKQNRAWRPQSSP